MEKDQITLNFEEDLNEIVGLIWNYMDQKYISAIKNKLDGYRGECEANLCKEAQLMQALMPFLPGESHILQLIIDALIYNDVIDRSLEEHEEFAVLYRDENAERQQLKKLVYKLIMFKLIKTIEDISVNK